MRLRWKRLRARWQAARARPLVRQWLLDNRGYRDVWLVVITALVTYAILVVVALTTETRQALCALRGDLENRVAGAEQFLAEHPNGTPGLPAKFVRTSKDGQKRTIIALSVLHCS